MVLAKEQIGGTEKRAQEQTHKDIINRSLTKEKRQQNGEKTVFSTNGAGTTGHLYAKKKKSLYTDLTPFYKN